MERQMEREIMRISKKLILEAGEMIKGMELEKNNLKTQEESMLEILLMINIKAKENLSMRNVFIKVILNMDCLMEKD
jgi:hypothetical protein